MRALGLLPHLVVLAAVGAACGDDDSSEIPIQTTDSIEVMVSGATPNVCPDSAGSYATLVDTETSFSGHALHIRSSCRCEYITGGSGCEKRRCDPDVIGHPTVCDETKREASILGVSASVDDRDCVVDVQSSGAESSSFTGHLRCTKTGVALVDVTVRESEEVKTGRLTFYVFQGPTIPCTDAGSSAKPADASADTTNSDD